MLSISVILIAAVSNLDNFAVGVAFGMRGQKIAATPNVIIATVTMAGTGSAIASGHWLSRLLPSTVASALGSLIIITIGAWTILGSLTTPRAPGGVEAHRSVSLPRNQDGNNDISPRDAVVLGIALSLNNVGSGIGAGVAGIPLVTTTLLAGAFSLLFIRGGSHAGRSAGQRLLGPRAPLAAGLLLLPVGSAMLAGAG